MHASEHCTGGHHPYDSVRTLKPQLRGGKRADLLSGDHLRGVGDRRRSGERRRGGGEGSRRLSGDRLRTEGDRRLAGERRLSGLRRLHQSQLPDRGSSGIVGADVHMKNV